MRPTHTFDYLSPASTFVVRLSVPRTLGQTFLRYFGGVHKIGDKFPLWLNARFGFKTLPFVFLFLCTVNLSFFSSTGFIFSFCFRKNAILVENLAKVCSFGNLYCLHYSAGEVSCRFYFLKNGRMGSLTI